MILEQTFSPHPSLAERLRGGFDGARVVILGGTGGIGRALAGQLTTLGARVVSGSRGAAAPGRDLAGPSKGAVVEVKVDLINTESLRHFANWTSQALGAVDILILTAGASRLVPLRQIELLDDETIDLVAGSNFTGVLRAIRDLTPLLRRGTEPCIVNVSSAAARTGVGSNLAYVGSKAAMDAVTIALAKALAPEIRVVGVAPSALETDFVRGRGRDYFDRTIAATPLGRLATPEEVADAILVAARLLPMTTGAVIAVDGGRSL